MSGRIVGSVISITDSGNLVTDITADQLTEAPKDESVAIRCDEHETNRIFDGEHSEPPFTLIAVIGASGNLELEIVEDSAKMMLGIQVGEKVVVQW